MKTALVFLTQKPHINTITFANELVRDLSFDTFIIADEEEQATKSDSVKIEYVSDDICLANGYFGCNLSGVETHIRKKVIAWDKFCYLFCEKYKDKYDFIWVFEEDVFIPYTASVLNLNEAYNHADLVVGNNWKNETKQMDWHWPAIYNIDKKGPYHNSMVSACGISRKVMKEVRKFKEENGQLYHHEAMFNTLAMKAELKVLEVFELLSIVWKGEWGNNEFLLLPDNLFHPVKDIDKHYLMRYKLSESIFKGEEPTENNLPDFIKTHM